MRPDSGGQRDRLNGALEACLLWNSHLREGAGACEKCGTPAGRAVCSKKEGGNGLRRYLGTWSVPPSPSNGLRARTAPHRAALSMTAVWAWS